MTGITGTDNWRFFARHEFGHVVMSFGRWRDGFHLAADSSAAWMMDEVAIAAFDRIGGAEYPGRKIPVDHDYCRCHWHPCVARGDVMANVWDKSAVITDLTTSMLVPGFSARSQTARLSGAEWGECP